jgi:hypothetical protein
LSRIVAVLFIDINARCYVEPNLYPSRLSRTLQLSFDWLQTLPRPSSRRPRLVLACRAIRRTTITNNRENKQETRHKHEGELTIKAIFLQSFILCFHATLLLIQSIYQRLTTHPMTERDQLWQEYEAFEQSPSESTDARVCTHVSTRRSPAVRAAGVMAVLF